MTVEEQDFCRNKGLAQSGLGHYADSGRADEASIWSRNEHTPTGLVGSGMYP